MNISKFFSYRWLCWTPAALLSLTSLVAQAAGPETAEYPNKTVRLIVPFGPGSSTDMVARIVAEEFQRELGQTFIVENRGGANGFIGAQAAAAARPDGYTLLVSSASVHTLNPSLFRKLPYNPEKDFTPVGATHRAYYTLTVNKDLPVNSVAELVSWLKKNPEKASYGWGATVGQIAGAEFVKRVGVRATGIAYKSSPQALVDLMGGQISFMFDGVPTTQTHILSNRLKGLAVTSLQRMPALPNVPTFGEEGLKDFEYSTWAGIFAPAETPPAIVQRLSSTLQKALRNPALAKRMDECCSAILFPTTSAEFASYTKNDRLTWQVKLKEAGVESE